MNGEDEAEVTGGEQLGGGDGGVDTGRREEAWGGFTEEDVAGA